MRIRRILRPAVARFASESVDPGAAFDAGLSPPLSASDAAPAKEPIAPATLDIERQSEARRYARLRQTLSLAELGVTAALVTIFLLTGLNFWLRDALAFVPDWSPAWGWQPLRVAAYALVLLVAALILGLPLDYYSGYILPRRYGLSTHISMVASVDGARGTSP